MSENDLLLPHSEGHAKYLRIKEAAAIMSVTYLWLYHRIKKGNGPPGTKMRGKMILIPRDSFSEWVKQDIIP